MRPSSKRSRPKQSGGEMHPVPLRRSRRRLSRRSRAPPPSPIVSHPSTVSTVSTARHTGVGGPSTASKLTPTSITPQSGSPYATRRWSAATRRRASASPLPPTSSLTPTSTSTSRTGARPPGAARGEALLGTFTSEQVACWFKDRGLAKEGSKLGNMTATELLRLSCEGFQTYLGFRRGIAVFNVLATSREVAFEGEHAETEATRAALADAINDNNERGWPHVDDAVGMRDEQVYEVLRRCSPRLRKLSWYKSPLGTELRLRFRSTHTIAHTQRNSWCILCSGHRYVNGDGKGAQRGSTKRIRRRYGHKSTFACSACGVQLCVKPHGDMSGPSCFTLWHQQRHLCKRRGGHNHDTSPPQVTNNEGLQASIAAAAAATTATTAAAPPPPPPPPQPRSRQQPTARVRARARASSTDSATSVVTDTSSGTSLSAASGITTIRVPVEGVVKQTSHHTVTPGDSALSTMPLSLPLPRPYKPSFCPPAGAAPVATTTASDTPSAPTTVVHGHLASFGAQVSTHPLLPAPATADSVPPHVLAPPLPPSPTPLSSMPLPAPALSLMSPLQLSCDMDNCVVTSPVPTWRKV